ncbi:MAG TPA: hypothetical protein VF442_12440, partial [Sphingobium sp.]
ATRALLPAALPDLDRSDQLTEEEQEDLQLNSSVAYYAVPIAIVHLVVIYQLVKAMTGFHLPAWLDGGKIIGLLWLNGAIVGALIWGWKRGGIAINGKVWLHGRSAVLLVIVGTLLILGELLLG